MFQCSVPVRKFNGDLFWTCLKWNGVRGGGGVDLFCSFSPVSLSLQIKHLQIPPRTNPYISSTYSSIFFDVFGTRYFPCQIKHLPYFSAPAPIFLFFSLKIQTLAKTPRRSGTNLYESATYTSPEQSLKIQTLTSPEQGLKIQTLTNLEQGLKIQTLTLPEQTYTNQSLTNLEQGLKIQTLTLPEQTYTNQSLTNLEQVLKIQTLTASGFGPAVLTTYPA